MPQLLALGLGPGMADDAAVLGPPSYSAEAATLFARMTVQPPPARKTLIDNTIVGLKAAGFWTRLDALYMFAAHDGQAALLNWIANQYNATSSGAAFTADAGYATDGAATYLDTNFNASTASAPNYTQNSAMFGIRMNDVGQAGATGSIGGAYDGTNGSNLNPRNASNTLQARCNNNSSVASVANTTTNGYFTGRRLAASGTNAIRFDREGANLVTSNLASTALPNLTFRVGGYSSANFRAGTFSSALLGQGFSDADVASLISILNANYFSPLGL
jgi:hypothetical protein